MIYNFCNENFIHQFAIYFNSAQNLTWTVNKSLLYDTFVSFFLNWLPMQRKYNVADNLISHILKYIIVFSWIVLHKRNWMNWVNIIRGWPTTNQQSSLALLMTMSQVSDGFMILQISRGVDSPADSGLD